MRSWWIDLSWQRLTAVDWVKFSWDESARNYCGRLQTSTQHVLNGGPWFGSLTDLLSFGCELLKGCEIGKIGQTKVQWHTTELLIYRHFRLFQGFHSIQGLPFSHGKHSSDLMDQSDSWHAEECACRLQAHLEAVDPRDPQKWHPISLTTDEGHWRRAALAARWLVLRPSRELRWGLEGHQRCRFCVGLVEQAGGRMYAEPEGLPCGDPWQWPKVDAFRALWWTRCAHRLHLPAAEHSPGRGSISILEIQVQPTNFGCIGL